jgi:hypothetical protein
MATDWLDFAAEAAGTCIDWMSLLSPRAKRRLVWAALAAAGLACGLVSGLTGMWWLLTVYGLGLLAGAAWLKGRNGSG